MAQRRGNRHHRRYATWHLATHNTNRCIGVNTANANLVSLHTEAYCTMPFQRYQAGTTISTNCDAKANFNQGCGTKSTKGTSYGSLFNNLGGGFFAMARSADDGIRVWFWQRDDPSVPPEVQQGYESISPSPSWGVPDASFPNGDFCDYNSHFDEHIIVFDLTFCVSLIWPLDLCEATDAANIYRAIGQAQISRVPDAALIATTVSSDLETFHRTPLTFHFSCEQQSICL